MGSVVADTHAVIWYMLGSEKLSSKARDTLDEVAQRGDSIYVTSISVVEVGYLVEKGKLPEVAFEDLIKALEDSGSVLKPVSLDMGVALTIRHVSRDTVPDMPDRIIAATALHMNLPLVTRDSRIQAAGIRVIW